MHIETEIEGLIKEIHDKSKQLTELHNCAAEKIKKINLSAYDCIPVHEYKNDIQGVMKSFERDFNLLQTNFMTKKNTVSILQLFKFQIFTYIYSLCSRISIFVIM